MDPITMALLASLGGKLIGDSQLAGIAPAPNMGGTQGVGGGSASALSRLAMENNFGGGMIGGLPTALQGIKEGATKPIEENPDADKKGGFFANLDSTLSSPSKTLLIGGLGQIDPRLGLAGLLASGFINGR